MSKKDWLFDRLTPRQREVAAGVYSGKTSREIGKELGISERTVEVHRFYASQILGTNNIAGLFRIVSQEKRHIQAKYPELDIK